MNCYAVIDTNVFVSALLSSNENAATVQVIEKFITGEIRAIYSYSTPAYRDPEWIEPISFLRSCSLIQKTRTY